MNRGAGYPLYGHSCLTLIVRHDMPGGYRVATGYLLIQQPNALLIS
ncbi:MAG TPA: hypothetical protein VIO57_02795 [Chloroflexota bacterium]